MIRSLIIEITISLEPFNIETKKVYITCLKKYFEFPGGMKVIDMTNPDGKKVENHIIDFVISLKKQGKSFAAISNYVSAVCKYYKMNDVVLNTNKIHQYLPEFRKARKDRSHRYEEIHRLLDVADERMRAIIFLLASTGMRIGAIPRLRLRNLEKVESEYDIYKIPVFSVLLQK